MQTEGIALHGQGKIAMTVPIQSECPEMYREIYTLYRDYFDRAERKRRWRLKEDIPWQLANQSIPVAVADVVETFCRVEMYLPDYLSKLIPQVRATRGRAWFLANWGYEESKHSLALGDWLVHSGFRTEEQMDEMDREVFEQEWDLPYGNSRGMVCYTMFQELATWLNYKNLRCHVEGRDPALDRVLYYLSIDERAHYDFFRKLVELYLKYDREATLEQLRMVVNTFKMPALHMFADTRHRVQQIHDLNIFSEEIFMYQIYEPILEDIGVTKAELRRKQSPRATVVINSPSS
jgi:acyl-[acyl-carrier-protein] desaturase